MKKTGNVESKKDKRSSKTSSANVKKFQKKAKSKVKGKHKNQYTLENGRVCIKDLLAPPYIDRSSADYLRVEDKFVRNFMIMGFPKEVAVGWLDNIYDYEGDLDMAIHVIPIDERKALDELTNKITQFETQLEMERSKGSNRNVTKLQAQIAELYAERAKAEQNYISLFNIQMIMNLFCDSMDQLDKDSQLLKSSMRGKRVKLVMNYLRQDQGYKSALPYGKSWLPRNFRNFSSEGLTACFPFYNLEISHPSGTMIGVNTQTKTPIYIDFYNRKLLNSGNTCVFGTTGSGKTFFTELLTMRSALNNIRTAIIDPEDEYEEITRALGGVVVDIAPNGTIPNPFDVIEEDVLDSEDKPTGEKEVRMKDKILDLLNLIGVMMSGNLTSDQRGLISTVLAKTYEDFGINENPESLYKKDVFVNEEGELVHNGVLKEMPTFSDFHDRLSSFADETGKKILEPVIDTLKMFRRDGVFGMFDCHTPKELQNLNNAPVVTFNVSKLNDDILRPIGMYIALSWCMGKFSTESVAIKKRIICDEAWMMVKKSMAGSEYTSHFLENCARRIRKRNGTLMISSQNFKEFLESPQGEAILFNTHVNIFFNQNPTDLVALQKKFDLSDGEKSFLGKAGKGNFLLKIGSESTTGYAYPFEYEQRLIEAKYSAKAAAKK